MDISARFKGGPVSEEYAQSRVELQQNILARMRELGMRPILQGFVGLVPLDFADKNPDARPRPKATGAAYRGHPYCIRTIPSSTE